MGIGRRCFLAALRHNRIDAPWVVDGPINGELFRLYVEKVLVPTLKPGDIVILPTDSAKSHPALGQAWAMNEATSEQLRWLANR
jgi:hypothetical protein